MANSPLSNVRVVSFGYLHGEPPMANIVLDVRCLTNPFYDENLRPLSGCDKPVQDFLDAQPETTEVLDGLRPLLKTMLPNYVRNASKYIDTFVIAVGCSGGKHRSRYMALRIAGIVRELCESLELDYEPLVTVEHRDEGKE